MSKHVQQLSAEEADMIAAELEQNINELKTQVREYDEHSKQEGGLIPELASMRTLMLGQIQNLTADLVLLRDQRQIITGE
jgi:hypothetical protein